VLTVENARVSYGGSRALDGAELTVGTNEFVAIVGPNGAGKTTLFRAISGTVPLESGRVLYDGRDLASVAAHDRPALGIAHVPEGRQVFPSLSVYENLEMGAQSAEARRDWKETEELVFTLFPRLAERRTQAAGTLSGGEQQMVAIARGLASKPRLLMLDEPSMGLAPTIADFIFDKLMEIRRQAKLTILLVEQRVAEALESADHGYVLEAGRVVLQGTSQSLRADDRVRQAYLGL
jgi:branched-chain amino acid transport system ATP-binding protein